VLREGSEYAGLDHASVPPANEAEASAQALKDQLVEFDRTATQRTTVIDDQSDYFEIDGNTWLSEKVGFWVNGSEIFRLVFIWLCDDLYSFVTLPS
jgi:hypothetical protein